MGSCILGIGGNAGARLGTPDEALRTGSIGREAGGLVDCGLFTELCGEPVEEGATGSVRRFLRAPED